MSSAHDLMVKASAVTMAELIPDDRQAQTVSPDIPRTMTDLREWVRSALKLDGLEQARLLEAIENVLGNQRQLLEESKHDAIRALTEGFAEKMSRLQGQLMEKDVTVSNIARYFEEVVAGLTDKSHRDPKTKLLNFDWFMERLESFLSVEQRVRWCGVGVVDINSFKWYNDTLGHAMGDRIIERGGADARDLHARFGGDEFCFLIPDLPGCAEAVEIADRFKHAVEAHDWGREDRRLGARPVRVDVGVVCLHLGPVAERRGVARKLAAELIHRADQLMYDAKSSKADHVHQTAVGVQNSALVEIEGDFVKARPAATLERRS